MKIVLDANVFSNLAFCKWLRERIDIEKMIPCIAYMDLVYHHPKRGRIEDYIDAFLQLNGIRVAPSTRTSQKLQPTPQLEDGISKKKQGLHDRSHHNDL